jgi:hypothetical protein
MTIGQFNVMLFLQSCTDPLQVLPGLSFETFPSSSNGTYDVGNVKFEDDIDIKEEEGIHSEEEEEEEVDIEEEVSCEDTV